jgi:hypothetical protein
MLPPTYALSPYTFSDIRPTKVVVVVFPAEPVIPMVLQGATSMKI